MHVKSLENLKQPPMLLMVLAVAVYALTLKYEFLLGIQWITGFVNFERI